MLKNGPNSKRTIWKSDNTAIGLSIQRQAPSFLDVHSLSSTNENLINNNMDKKSIAVSLAKSKSRCRSKTFSDNQKISTVNFSRE